jgi:hypothetical protein
MTDYGKAIQNVSDGIDTLVGDIADTYSETDLVERCRSLILLTEAVAVLTERKEQEEVLVERTKRHGEAQAKIDPQEILPEAQA